MLGSDPIYQYGDSPGMHTLEPVYTDGGGGSPEWVEWFMGCLIHQPSLAFAYAQAGQENSFGWQAMKNRLHLSGVTPGRAGQNAANQCSDTGTNWKMVSIALFAYSTFRSDCPGRLETSE